MQLIRTLCPFCGVGCSFFLKVEDGKVIGVESWKDDPVSNGKPCVKGLSSWQMIYADDRIKQPLIREGKKLKPASWGEAYEFIYKNLSKLKGEQIAFYGSSPGTNEDNYLLQKFAREILKAKNIDSCARLCHATTCYAFYETFGITAMPSMLEDFEKADCILIIGSNPKITYPVAFDKILKAKKNGAKLICVRDWKDDTSRLADIYVEISDGTELAFLNGVLDRLIEIGAVNVPSELKKILKKYSEQTVVKLCKTKECKLTVHQIKKVASLIAKSKKFVLGFGMNLTQHSYGTQNVLSACNLVLAKKGKIISMRGKANIQGVGDMGCVPRIGGDTFISSVFVQPVKALYIMESNPAQSLPDLNKVHKSFKKMFVILHTTFPNKTMEFADVVLPSCSWAERDGTFTSAESRIRYLNKTIEPLYGSKPNWKILCGLVGYFGAKWDYGGPDDIFSEIRYNIAGYKKINLNKLKRGGSEFVFRPVKYKKFHLVEFYDAEQRTNTRYPFVMSTERVQYQFCTGEMSKRTNLNKLAPEAKCLIGIKDAKRLSIKNGDLVKIKSKVGAVKIKAEVSKYIPSGLIVAPFHFEDVLINKAVPLEFGPIVEEPNLKRIAVRIEKIKKK